ncbi:MAG: PIN domain-containing protein [Patescibacteria group bacterium]
MRQSLFIDTNVICSLYNPKDSLNTKAEEGKHLFKEYQPVLSNFILLETYTILSQRVSKEFAIKFGQDIQQEHRYVIYWIDKKLEEEVWKIFKSIKNKNFSYVDASILAIMKKEKISHLLSFDTTFKNLQKQFKFQLVG